MTRQDRRHPLYDRKRLEVLVMEHFQLYLLFLFYHPALLGAADSPWESGD